MSNSSKKDLARALAAAGHAHHDYEQVYLEGKRDEQWSGFYAAYVLGRLGDFVVPSVLSRWLEWAPEADDWAGSAAEHVLAQMAQ